MKFIVLDIGHITTSENSHLKHLALGSYLISKNQ
jgi:hypothetical protein